MKLKKVATSLLFLLITFAILWGVSEVLESKVSYSEYNPFFESTTGHDVIFLGSSHMYNGVLPMELWSKFGITSYNWGYSNCTLPLDFYILKILLEEGVEPELFVIDLYGLVEYESKENKKHGKLSNVEQYHVQFDVLPSKVTKYEMTQDVFDDYEGRWDFMFPFLMYHNRWNNLTMSDFMVEDDYEKGAGFLLGTYINEGYTDVEGEKGIAIESVCAEYVKNIVELCKSHNIKVLFIYIPYEHDQQNADVATSVEDWIVPMGADYLNTIYWDGIDKYTDFYDSAHLNYSGACKYTEYMGEYLQKNYLLENHKGESGYECWDEDLLEYIEYRDAKLNELE